MSPILRDATRDDLPALTALKAGQALHLDRLRDANGRDMRYLVIEHDNKIVGFLVLVFKRPETWPDHDDQTRLPALVDLFIDPLHRGNGLGSWAVMEIEKLLRQSGHDRLYLGVDPVDNQRAHALYRRLGFVDVMTSPERRHWKFVDSAGQTHEWEEWAMDMVKELGQREI